MMIKLIAKVILLALGLSLLSACDIRDVVFHNRYSESPYQYPPYNGYPVYYNGKFQDVP